MLGHPQITIASAEGEQQTQFVIALRHFLAIFLTFAVAFGGYGAEVDVAQSESVTIQVSQPQQTALPNDISSLELAAESPQSPTTDSVLVYLLVSRRFVWGVGAGRRGVDARSERTSLAVELRAERERGPPLSC